MKTRWKLILVPAASVTLMVLVLPLAGRAENPSDNDIRRVVVIHLDTTRVDDLG